VLSTAVHTSFSPAGKVQVDGWVASDVNDAVVNDTAEIVGYRRKHRRKRDAELVEALIDHGCDPTACLITYPVHHGTGGGGAKSRSTTWSDDHPSHRRVSVNDQGCAAQMLTWGRIRQNQSSGLLFLSMSLVLRPKDLASHHFWVSPPCVS
jgi:hypothetical protein